MSIAQAVVGAMRSRRDVFNVPGILPDSPTWSSPILDQGTATRINAVHACWGLLTDSVGLLPIDVFTKSDEGRIPTERPDWLDTPDPNDPNLTIEEHFSQVMMSLVSDGNSFTLVLPEVLDPAELRVLDPRRIECRRSGREPRYIYRLEGGGTETLGPDQILHVSRLRRPGELRGLSPIDEALSSIAKTRAADQFGNRVFVNGMLITGALTVPGQLTKENRQDLRDELAETYTGANQGKPGVFSSGATFTYPQIDLEQLQLLEVLRWGVLDIARLYHIPPHKAGDNQPGAVSYKSVEHLAIEYVNDAVRPYAERIEPVYRRLLPDRRVQYLKFNLAALLRGDHITRFQAYQIGLTSKFMKVDEVRALEEMPPLGSPPGTGEGGLLQTPNNNAPGTVQQADPNAPDSQRGVTHVHPTEVRTFVQMPEPVVNVSVPQPVVNVAQPPAVVVPAPRVSVAPPAVTVAAPTVNVAPPAVEIRAPDINVNVEPIQDIRIVSMPAPAPRDQIVKRDPQGRITGIQEV